MKLRRFTASARKSRWNWVIGGFCPNLFEGLILYAVASVLRERLGLAFAPTDEVDYRKAIQRFRAELGDSEYKKLWYNGRQLSLKTAVQLAFPGMETD